MPRFFDQDGQRYDVFNLPADFVISGSLDLSYMGLTELPDLSTVTVLQNFYCHNNKLRTLHGSPMYVGRNFFAANNWLEDLGGCPKIIQMVFEICGNRLETLENGPEYTGTYLCQNNFLTSLRGIASNEMVRFDCRNNRLVSLDFAPFMVKTALYDGNNISAKSKREYENLVRTYHRLVEMRVLKQRYVSRTV